MSEKAKMMMEKLKISNADRNENDVSSQLRFYYVLLLLITF